MAWFDRHRGARGVEEAREELDRALAGSGLLVVVDAASGPTGLRRYLVRFEDRAGRLRVTGLDAVQLPEGGGPPSAPAFDANAAALERALESFRRALPPPFSFGRGALAVVRDDRGLELDLHFDEDADALTLGSLRKLKGRSTPVEDPGYLKALAAWESRIAPVRDRWILPRPGETWTLENGVLHIEGPAGPRSLPAEPLARYTPKSGAFEWLLDAPAGEEAPFVEPELIVEPGQAMELAMFAAARLGRVGVFQGDLADKPPGLLFATLRE